MLFALLERLRGLLMPYPFWIKNLGARGEYLARRHFHRKGYHLLAKNWRFEHGEIDVIMANEHEVLFLEAKTRKRLPSGRYPLLRRAQEKRLKALIRVYCREWPNPFAWRLLLVTVLPARRRGWQVDAYELHRSKT